MRYTARGKALLVGGIEDVDVNYYDTETRNSLFLPLPHPAGVSQIASNASGSLVVTVTNDGVARLWRMPSSIPVPPPKWLGEYLRAFGGLSFSAGQQLTQAPTRERLSLREKLLRGQHDSSLWDEVMAWSFQRTSSGAADPWSNATK